MYDPMPSAYAACAANEDRQMRAGERYAQRLQDKQIDTVSEWVKAEPFARACDMRDALDHRDFDEKLFALLMKCYSALDADAIALVHDMARCRAELTVDAYDDED